jgi:hypothetical protein
MDVFSFFTETNQAIMLVYTQGCKICEWGLCFVCDACIMHVSLTGI